MVGNWKMNPLTQAQARQLVQDSLEAVGTEPSAVQVGWAPALVHLPAVSQALHGAGMLVAQDVAMVSGQGAYTGEVSAQQLVDVGVQAVLVGHSERRQHQQETGAVLAAKVQAALQAGLRVIFCVGETWQQRQAGQATAVVLEQLQPLLTGVDSVHWPLLLVAYEPVWAIGTGQVASASDAQEMHTAIRAALRQCGTELASTPILYGGSVKADNAAALTACADVDGALVGGASLDPTAFAAIVAAFA